MALATLVANRLIHRGVTLRRHLSPAMVISLLALVLGASGGAYAASTGSSGTIAACLNHRNGVLYVAHRCARKDQSLKWNVAGPQGTHGLQGPKGDTGSQGTQGIQGPQGDPGPFPGVLPSGKTIRGTYYTAGGVLNGTSLMTASEGISFGFVLASTPTAQVIHLGDPTTAQCSGSAANPTAVPGYLCVYEADSQDKRDSTYPHVFGVTPFGAAIYTQGSNASADAGSFFWSRGSWAVTSP